MKVPRLCEILGQFPRLRIAVVGDFFLDKYLLIDPELDEPSVETGLTAYQIVGKRRSPGAAGTVVNNLKALGVDSIDAVGMSGVDGEGYELRTELTRLGVNQEHFYAVEERFTPTYTKPMVQLPQGPERELNRLDIKNRKPLPPWVEEKIEKALESLVERVDAIMIMDQVSQENCGVITDRVRKKIAWLGKNHPAKILYADSGGGTDRHLRSGGRRLQRTCCRSVLRGVTNRSGSNRKPRRLDHHQTARNHRNSQPCPASGGG